MSPLLHKTRQSHWITRVDQPSKKTHGWNVRPGNRPHKFFSDKVWGSELRAKRMAFAYRDACLRLLSPPPARLRQPLREHQPSGVKGVHHVIQAKPKKVYQYWRAVPVKPGTPGSKMFSWEDLGKDEALKLAINHRRRLEIQAKIQSKQP